VDALFFQFGVPASVFLGQVNTHGKKIKSSFLSSLLKIRDDACAGNILSKRLRKIVSSMHFRKKDLTCFNFWRILLGSLLFV